MKKLKTIFSIVAFVAVLAIGGGIGDTVAATPTPCASRPQSDCTNNPHPEGFRCRWGVPANSPTGTSATCHAVARGGGDLNLIGGVEAGEGDNVPSDLFGGAGAVTIIVNVLLFIVGIISVIMLIIGGIKYSTSAGDSGKVTTAKNTIMYAIVGLVVAILAFAIVNFVVDNIAD
ncbi:pilin [Candidatus Saccharibacteria bacterium]|nr:pilin [Candidatus Saccharibacteria bacterium]